MLLIRRLFHRIKTMNALNKIIDEMDKDLKLAQTQAISFRNRAIEVEQSLEKHKIWLQNSKIKPKPPVDDNPYL